MDSYILSLWGVVGVAVAALALGFWAETDSDSSSCEDSGN